MAPQNDRATTPIFLHPSRAEVTISLILSFSLSHFFRHSAPEENKIVAMLPINLPGNIHQLTRYHMRLANQASSVPTLAAVRIQF